MTSCSFLLIQCKFLEPDQDYNANPSNESEITEKKLIIDSLQKKNEIVSIWIYNYEIIQQKKLLAKM